MQGTSLAEERWAQVAGYPNYEVSNHGRVRRRQQCGNRLSGSMLRQRQDGKGYWRIALWSQPEQRSHCALTHRLVALAFLGEPTPPATEVDHLNGNTSDNRASNMEWVTKAENLRRARLRDLTRTDTCRRLGAGHRSARFTAADVRQIRAAHAAGEAQCAIARARGVSQVAIHKIVKRQTWAHVQ